jgi:hypothetical protein
MDDVERRRRRLDSARFLIRAELAIALAAPLILAFLYIAAPGNIGGGMFAVPWFIDAVPWVAAAGVIVGVAWMIRLSRADPEAGERSWRYRDF